MLWHSYIRGFKMYMDVEKGLSPNTISAYTRDVEKLADFIEQGQGEVAVAEITTEHIRHFLAFLRQCEIDPRSQSRILSGLRAFFSYLTIENIISADVTDRIEAPKIGTKIPVVLSVEEVKKLMEGIDLSDPRGHRNRAILEMLYACGLRVSELTGLTMEAVYPELEMIKVRGKNNKERLVPVSQRALKFLNLYLKDRAQNPVKQEHKHIVFLNRRGRQLSRSMIFRIIREAAEQSGLDKNISPHTLRHCFATHLVEGGADLRAVQELLGHSSIMTTEIYTHINNEYLRRTIYKYHPLNRTFDE